MFPGEPFTGVRPDRTSIIDHEGRNRTTDTRIFSLLTAVREVYQSITCSACQPRPQAHHGTPNLSSTHSWHTGNLDLHGAASLTNASTNISIRLFRHRQAIRNLVGQPSRKRTRHPFVLRVPIALPGM